MALYKEDIIDIELESGSIHRSWMNHAIGLGDVKANRFGVRIFRNGEAVNIGSGTCQGFFMRPDGTNLQIQGSTYTGVDGNLAWVQLPQDAYAFQGQFCLAIKLIGEGITGTMRIIDGMVDNTGTTGAVSPTSTVPTSQEIIAAYNNAVTVIDNSVRYDIDQSLTAAQKTKARTNIEAASTGEVSDLESASKGIQNVLEGELKELFSCENLVEYIYKDFVTGTGTYVQKIAWQDTNIDSDYYYYAYIEGVSGNKNNMYARLRMYDVNGSSLGDSSLSLTTPLAKIAGVAPTSACKKIALILYGSTEASMTSSDKAEYNNIYIGKMLKTKNTGILYPNYSVNDRVGINVDKRVTPISTKLAKSKNVLFYEPYVSVKGQGGYVRKEILTIEDPEVGKVYYFSIGGVSGNKDATYGRIDAYNAEGTSLGYATINTSGDGTAYIMVYSSYKKLSFTLRASNGTDMYVNDEAVFTDVCVTKGKAAPEYVVSDSMMVNGMKNLYVSQYTGADDNERLQSIINDAIEAGTATVYIDEKLYITDKIDIEFHPDLNIIIDGCLPARNWNNIFVLGQREEGVSWGEPECGIVCNVDTEDGIVFDLHSDKETDGLIIRNLAAYNNGGQQNSSPWAFNNNKMILFNNWKVCPIFENISAYGFYYFHKSPGHLDDETVFNVHDNLTFINIMLVSCGYGIQMYHADLGYIRNYTYIGHTGLECMLDIQASKGVNVINCGTGIFAVHGSQVATRGEAEFGVLIRTSNVNIDGFHQERNEFKHVFFITDNSRVSIKHGNSVTSNRTGGSQVLSSNGSNVLVENCNFELPLRTQSDGELSINKSGSSYVQASQSGGIITSAMGFYRITTNDLSLSVSGNTLTKLATKSGDTITVPVKASAAMSPQGLVTINETTEYPEITLEPMPEYIDMIICSKK